MAIGEQRVVGQGAGGELGACWSLCRRAGVLPGLWLVHVCTRTCGWGAAEGQARAGEPWGELLQSGGGCLGGFWSSRCSRLQQQRSLAGPTQKVLCGFAPPLLSHQLSRL